MSKEIDKSDQLIRIKCSFSVKQICCMTIFGPVTDIATSLTAGMTLGGANMDTTEPCLCKKSASKKARIA